MAVLEFDKIGERIYQTGVDRGILYIDDLIVPWNGLISVEESSNPELKSFYLDGVKYLENLAPGDFLGQIKAYTYPDEFNLVNGIVNPVGFDLVTPIAGLSYHDQPSKSFNLSYRTKLGNDVEGTELGYRIHILYNLIAVPDSMAFETIQDEGISPIEFGWSLSGTPIKINGFRPTVHISMDSTKTPEGTWTLIEEMLYGSVENDPIFPSIAAISLRYLGDD